MTTTLGVTWRTLMTLIKGPELRRISGHPLITPGQGDTTQGGQNTVLLAGQYPLSTASPVRSESSAGTALVAQDAPQPFLISDPPPSPSAPSRMRSGK